MEETQQSTQAVAGAADQMLPITVTHLVVIALFALVVLVAICWGIRARAKRRAADRKLAANNAVRHTAPDAPVADPDAPNAAVTVERRAPVEPADLPAPAPPPVQAPQQDAVPPAPAPAEQPSAPTAPVASDLTTLKGLGPKVAAQLAELGITSIADLAALSPAEAERIDASLGSFQGRMARDRWVEQAQLLAAGDRAGYEAKFGKLG